MADNERSANLIQEQPRLRTRYWDPSMMITWIAIAPAILFTVLFFIFPMFRMFQISFYRSLGGALMEPATNLDNYLDFLMDTYYLNNLALTVEYGVIVTIISLILSFPLAYTLVRGTFPGKNFFIGIVLFPLLMNSIVLVFAWYVIFGQRGPFIQLINLIIPDISTLQILNSPTAVLIGLVHQALPFTIITIMAAISNISPSLEDAAASLGASRFHIMTKVVIPLAMPGILGGALLAFTAVLSGFLYPLYLGGNTTNIMPLLIYKAVSETSNWPFGASMTFILLVTTILFFSLIALLLKISKKILKSYP
jgi:putative spermidine/putrescine transport system permease protein